MWIGWNGCRDAAKKSAEPDRAGDGTSILREVYSDCENGGEVDRIENGGHTWPGGKQYLPVFVVGKTTRNLDASEAIWEFFRRHPMTGNGK